jgi:RNA polymerase sigma factor (sigma-70 family)
MIARYHGIRKGALSGAFIGRIPERYCSRLCVAWRKEDECTSPPATRRSLIVKLRDPADQAAWCEFVTLYEPLVYRLARSKGLQDADAKDVCQEVFRAVSQAIGRWDPDPGRGTFRGWLSRITRNLLINFVTRRPHQLCGSGATSVQDLLEAQPARDPSATAYFESEYRKRLFQWAADEVRHEFTPATWAAFWQTAIEGRLPKDVAAGLGISVGAVYIARSRALARLRQRIEQRSDEDVFSD